MNRFRIPRKQRKRNGEVKSFKESQEKEKAFDFKDRGINTVSLDQIVGSVGRYHDFDGRFRLKEHLPHERLEAIKKAMKEGASLPPVELYQIKGEYYVSDGNHRISAAKELNFSDIKAHIVELFPSKDTLENLLYRERSQFREKTGLPDTIALTEVGQYTHLIKQISEHHRFLDQAKGEKRVTFENAASDWYHTIYLPLVAIIERGHLIVSFPKRTVADLYAYISFYQWEMGLKRKYGIGIDQLIPANMEEFRKMMSHKEEHEYPEMRREITVFILMNVAAKKEYQIIEKLYALKEVREIHSVHGDVDIIAKIVLTRDLLSSDAEVISQFVHNQVGQLSGVVSTQTLIPGVSKIKKDPTA